MIMRCMFCITCHETMLLRLSKRIIFVFEVFDAEEKLETERLEEDNQRNNRIYNYFFSVTDREFVEPEVLKNLLGEEGFADLPEAYQGGMPGISVKDYLRGYLNNQFWATREQQARMDEELDRSTQFKFAPDGEGSASRYSELYAMAERGMLTVEELNTDTFRITAAQHRELNMKIFNEANEALNDASRLLKRAFKYNEQQAIGQDDRLAQASKTAFEAADFALQDEFMRRELEGNPMTRAEVRDFAKEKIEEFGEVYREELRIEYETYVIDVVRPGLGDLNFTLDLNSPIESLDSWFAGLEADEQALKRSKYTTYKRIIRARFGNQGLF